MSLVLLKLGSVGPEVTAWELFLKGRYPRLPIVVNDRFEQQTHDATVQFQRDNKLMADGIVGIKTYAVAMKFGFNPGVQDDRDESGPNWPRKPLSLIPLQPAQRERLFGKFSYVADPKPTNPEAIRITDGWAKENIVRVTIKQLVGIPGAPKDGRIELNVKIAPQFVAMFNAWETAGLIDRIKTFGGSWVPRFVRGSRTSLSNHSWGNAIDINVKWNGLGTVGALKGEEGSVRELVEIAAEYGQYWGGWFTRPDPMHLEAYVIK